MPAGMKAEYSTYELRERERLYHTVFDASPDAIFIEDLDGNVLDVNPAACRLHGLTRNQLIGKNVSDLVPKEHRHMVVGQTQLVEGEVEGYSLSIDGRRIPVSIRSSAIAYMGRPAILLHVRDITARRKAEEAMIESQEHYKLLFNSHPQPMWVHDLESQRFIAVNNAAVRLYKYSVDEFLAMENVETVRGKTEADDSDLLGLANLVRVETAKHRRKDGVTLNVELTQHTIALDGRFAAFVMISKVISSSR
jgi:PAS domain S-box-containing protein